MGFGIRAERNSSEGVSVGSIIWCLRQRLGLAGSNLICDGTGRIYNALES